MKYQHAVYHRYPLRNVPDPNGSNRKIILEKGRVIYLEDKDDLQKIIALWEKKSAVTFCLPLQFSLMLFLCCCDEALSRKLKLLKRSCQGIQAVSLPTQKSLPGVIFLQPIEKILNAIALFLFGRRNCTCRIKVFRILEGKIFPTAIGPTFNTRLFILLPCIVNILFL